MGEVIVHQARLRLTPDGDPGAPGAGITVELCGHWEHEGPCGVPHHTSVKAAPDGIAVIRTIAVAHPDEIAGTHGRIHLALERGAVDGPGRPTWRLIDDGPAEPTDEELAHGRRIGGVAGS